ncbi:unnamed protein product [Colias eurytheme]|nr:unnamed protein product [Colias eurytheme]
MPPSHTICVLDAPYVKLMPPLVQLMPPLVQLMPPLVQLVPPLVQLVPPLVKLLPPFDEIGVPCNAAVIRAAPHWKITVHLKVINSAAAQRAV